MPRRARPAVELLEPRVVPVTGSGANPFAADPRTVINGGDNLSGLVQFASELAPGVFGPQGSGSLLDLGGGTVGTRYILTAAHLIVATEGQRIHVGGTGTYRLRVSHSGQTATTAPIPAGANDLDVQAALEALPNVGAGNVIVDGPAPDTGDGDHDPATTQFYLVRFVRALNGINVDDLTPVDVTGPVVNQKNELNQGFDNSAGVRVYVTIPRERDVVGASNQDNRDLITMIYDVPAENIFVHPDWDGVVGFEDELNPNAPVAATPDIAVIVLPSAAPFVAASYQPYTGSDEVGREFRIAGYGIADGDPSGLPIANLGFDFFEFQRLTVAATGGTFDLTLGGRRATVAYASDPAALAASIDAAVETLPGIVRVDVRYVSGGPDAGSFEIKFAETAPLDRNPAQLRVDAANLAGTATVRTIQNKRRSTLFTGTNTFTEIQDGGTYLRGGFLAADTDPLTGIGNSGDSGGPSFIDVGNGDLAVAGVNSFRAARPEPHLGVVRVSQFLDFIAGSVAAAGPYPLVIDLFQQQHGRDGLPDSHVLRRSGDFLEFWTGRPGAEVLAYRDALDRVSSVTVRGTVDDETLTIDLSGGDPVPAGGLTFDGKGGADRLIGPGAASTWTVTGPDTGTLAYGGGTRVTFTAVGALTGGPGADTFVFAAEGTVRAVEGDGGDVLDFTAWGPQPVVPLGPGAGRFVNRVPVTDEYAGIGSLVGPTLTVPPPVPPPPPTVDRPRTLSVGGSATGTAVAFVPGAGGTYTGSAARTTPAGVFGGFAGEVRTASGDFDGDGVEDTVLVTGPGTKTMMSVVSGKDGKVLLPATDPLGDANFTFGAFVTAGDLDGDGRSEWVVTPELRGGPRVVVFHMLADGTFDLTSPGQPSLVANFFGIGDPSFRDGDRSALGDVNGDGVLDIFSIAAFNGGPRTALYDGRDVLAARAAGRDPVKLTGDFFATTTGAGDGRGGRSIAVGDINGDGRADLIVTGDNLLGTGNQITVFSGADLAAGRVPGFGATVLANFAVSGQNPAALVSVAAVDADGDTRADLAIGSGPGQPSLVKVYLGKDVSGAAEPASASFDPFGTIALNGVFVG